MSPQTMSLVLDWIYTGSTSLNSETVQDLLLAGDMLLLHRLSQICFQFMEQNMDPENWIGIWKFSDVVLSIKTRDLAQRFILRNFKEVMDVEEFQELTAEDLDRFIENDELNVKDETVVFKAILHWINHDLQKRRDAFPHLLTKVRFAQISYDFVRNNVLNNPLVDNNQECMTTMINTRHTILEVALNPRSQFRLARPRLPEAILLAIGGWASGNPTNIIEAYNYKTDCWVNVTNHEERPRAYHGSVFLDGSVCRVGGFDRTEHFNSAWRLDLTKKIWHEMPPMYHRHCYVSMVVLSGHIYAMGGFNGHARLKMAEVFDPQIHCWTLIGPMNEQRSDSKAAALNGKAYDPLVDSWRDIYDMHVKRSALNCCVISDLPNMADYTISRDALPLLDLESLEWEEVEMEEEAT